MWDTGNINVWIVSRAFFPVLPLHFFLLLSVCDSWQSLDANRNDRIAGVYTQKHTQSGTFLYKYLATRSSLILELFDINIWPPRVEKKTCNSRSP